MKPKNFLDKLAKNHSHYMPIAKVLVVLKIVKNYQGVDSFLKSNKVYINGTLVDTPWFKVFKGERLLRVNREKYKIKVQRGTNPPVYIKDK